MTRVKPADEPGSVLIYATLLGLSFDLFAELLRERYRRHGIAPPRGVSAALREVSAVVAGTVPPPSSDVGTVAPTPANIEISEKTTSAVAAQQVGCRPSYSRLVAHTGTC